MVTFQPRPSTQLCSEVMYSSCSARCSATQEGSVQSTSASDCWQPASISAPTASSPATVFLRFVRPRTSFLRSRWSVLEPLHGARKYPTYGRAGWLFRAESCAENRHVPTSCHDTPRRTGALLDAQPGCRALLLDRFQVVLTEVIERLVEVRVPALALCPIILRSAKADLDKDLFILWFRQLLVAVRHETLMGVD